jgi:sulfofructose kinase
VPTPRILCIGIPVRDLAFQVADVPARGSKANATSLSEICGGNALNAAIAIARLGGRVSLAGPMGDARESSSGFILDRMAQEGVDTRHIVRMPGLATPISAIMIDAAGERTLTIYRDPVCGPCNCPAPTSCSPIARRFWSRAAAPRSVPISVLKRGAVAFPSSPASTMRWR